MGNSASARKSLHTPALRLLITALICLGSGAMLWAGETGDVSTVLRQDQIGKRVTVIGTAQNAKSGAVLLTGSETVYLKDKDSWEPAALNQILRVTGILQTYELPAATQKNGEWSAGVTGNTSAFRLENFQWHVDPIAVDIGKLKASGRSDQDKWEISRRIQREGKAAIPDLIACRNDPAAVGVTPLIGGECINRPGHLPVPPQCKNPVRTETLGERCELMLYNILTPAYISPFMTPLPAKDVPGRPFVIPDWNSWWQEHGNASLDDLHREAKKKIDEFWLNNHREAVVWK